MPAAHPWQVLCRACGSHLYTYAKRGKGNLIKCIPARIVHDSTAPTADNPHSAVCQCPKCNARFCRPRMVNGSLAHKLIYEAVKIVRIE